MTDRSIRGRLGPAPRERAATPEAKSEAGALIPVAKVLRPWGRRGGVLAELSTDNAARLLPGRSLLLGGSQEEGGSRITVSAARDHSPGRAVIEIEGIDSIEAAEDLRGRTLYAPRSEIGPPPEGAYYAFQLLGMRAVTISGEVLGRIVEIRPTGGADLLVVHGSGREHLIPFVRSICPRIDPEEGLIEVDPPKGLLELDEI